MTEQNLTKLTINTLTKSQYQALYNSGDISYTEIYLITDDDGTGVYALANNVYTKAEIDDIIANLPSGGGSGTGVDLSDYYTKDEITALLANKANTSDLSDYVELADLANVATSGDYNDLSNTPTIPSKTSDLTNDSGYVSSSSLSTVATSGSYNDLSNKPDLTVYETKAEAFSGDYNDLTNKPDLSVYQTVANSFSGDYDDLSNKPDLSAYQTVANAFSGSYNDLTDKPTIPTIPTNISSFTNDSGYQTASNVNTAIATALTGYATESYVQTAVQGLGNVFTIKGSVSTVANLPASNNTIGDVYYVAEKQAGYIWIEIDNVEQWEELGETIDLSNYVQTSDLTWNNISDKPTIPDAVSGTYSGSNWTSITIGNTTKNIPSGGSTPANMVTTDTAQEITGAKVFKGSYKITCQSTANEGASVAFKASSQSSNQFPIGVMEIDEGLKVMKFSVNGVVGPDYVPALGYFGGSSDYNYVAKLPKGRDKFRSISSGDIYLPLSVNKTKADSSGNISLNIPDAVSGTNDGTNWTSLTIGNDTYGLASGTSVSGTNDGSNWTSLTIGNTTYNIPSGGSSSGSTPTNMVTTDTDQNITGVKTFVGKQKLKFKQSASNDTLGFTAYDMDNNELGNLQVANRASGGSTYPYVTLGNFSTQSNKAKVGFRVQPNSSQKSYNFVMPYGTNDDFTSNGYYTNADTTFPFAFTDGIATVKADAAGLVDLSTLNLGGSGSGSGSAPSNMVTTDTAQTINGRKTFITSIDVVNRGKGMQFHSGSNGSTSAKLGFTFYNSTAGSTSNEVGFLESYTGSALNGGHSTLLGYYNNAATSTAYRDWDLGFAYCGYSSVKGGVTAYKLVVPNQYNLNDYNTKRYIPIDFTNGTTTVRPDATGVVDISSLLSGGGGGSSVSGTNDGTNWTSLTINGSTYNIPAGGASSSSGSGIVDINDIPLVEGELVVKRVQLFDEETGDPLLDENGDPITEERLGLGDWVGDVNQRLDTLEQNSGGNVPTKTSDLINDSGFITNATSSLTNYYTSSELDDRFNNINNNINNVYDDLLNANVDPANYPTAQTQTLTNLYVPSSDTLYTVSGGGSSSGPTVTKYDTSSYLYYTWEYIDRSYAILNGNPNSGEFRIQDTNPGDILLFDVSLDYYVNNSMRSRRHLIEVTVPIKSTNDHYDKENTYLSSSYKIFRASGSSADTNTMVLEIENLDIDLPYRVQIGALMVPHRDSSVDTNATINIKSITHIAF